MPVLTVKDGSQYVQIKGTWYRLPPITEREERVLARIIRDLERQGNGTAASL
jgi:hypothetical protein